MYNKVSKGWVWYSSIVLIFPTRRGRSGVILLLNSDHRCWFTRGGNHTKCLRNYFVTIFLNKSSRESQGLNLVIAFKPSSNWPFFLEDRTELSLGSCRWATTESWHFRSTASPFYLCLYFWLEAVFSLTLRPRLPSLRYMYCNAKSKSQKQ